MGDAASSPIRRSFNPQRRVEFRGATVTSNAGLLLPRELDERLGFSALIAEDSTAFAADNSAIIDGMQAAFNQDNGTWRVDYIRMMGFTGAGEHFARWFSAIPNEITDHIELDIPGMPESGVGVSNRRYRAKTP